MDQRRELLHGEHHHDPAWVIALVDGVIAIVITLLVLEIHVPELHRVRTSTRDSSRRWASSGLSSWGSCSASW